MREERQRKLALDITRLLARATADLDIVREILEAVKESAGIEAAGIRLKDGDDFPYYSTIGFPIDFIESENFLCARTGDLIKDPLGKPILECMCGNVLSGRFDPAKPFFTEGGSFWTSSTSALLAATTDEDRGAHTRNRCNSQGYESVALIPLRAPGGIVGLLQLNDGRKDIFTPELIEYFEGLGVGIGLALSRIELARAAENGGKAE